MRQAETMLNPSAARRILRLAGALAAAAALAGCNSSGGSGGATSPYSPSRWTSLLSFGPSKPAPATTAANTPQLRSCPEATILDGGAALRVGGNTSQSVRYQFAITDVARECQLQGNTLAIKVGVEGNLLIGPAGSAGTQSATVRVSLRAEKDQHIMTTRTYRVSATSTGLESGTFTLVTENFTAPFISEYSGDDYSIVVAFEGSRPAAENRGRGRRR